MREILLICMSAVLLTACDNHQEFPDIAMKVGHILCTDGQVLPYANYKESNKKAVGVVFYLNRDWKRKGKGMPYISMIRQPKLLRTVSE